MTDRGRTLVSPSSAHWEALWRQREAAGFGTSQLLPKHELAADLLTRLRRRDPGVRTICDLGCGPAILLRHLRHRHPDLSLAGADFTDAARHRIEAMGLPYLHFDLTSDTLRQSFDVGLLVDVLEHFHDPVAVLKRLPTLRYIIVVVPNFSFLTERVSAVLGQVPFQWRNRLHETWFNVRTLESVASGYQVVDRGETYPATFSRLPFRHRFANLLATSLGVVLRPSGSHSTTP